MEEAEGKDLISALPDAVILHIFSFLDAKDVVKTSALSRRWSSLWTQTPAVSFDFLDLYPLIVDDFSLFDRFLLRCTSPAIHKFHLFGLNYLGAGKDKFDQWIRFAVDRRVEDLSITSEGEDSEGEDNKDDDNEDEDSEDEGFDLPSVLLLCESLTNLQLESFWFPPFTNYNSEKIRWSSLKVLIIHGSYMPYKVIDGILEGSPRLESLTLVSCYGMDSIRILSRTMRELVIRQYDSPRAYEGFSDEENEYGSLYHKNLCLEIFAPYLRKLRLQESWVGKEVIVLKEASSLVEVELNFSLTFIRTNLAIFFGAMKDILSKLHYVDKFIVGDAPLKVLHHYKGNVDFSLQLKCRHLTITIVADEYSFGRIEGALERAPNVETLVIDFAHKTSPGGMAWVKDPFCNRKPLKTGRMKNIVIRGFPVNYGQLMIRGFPIGYGHDKSELIYGLSLIKAVLRDAQVLEKMVVNAKWPWRRDLGEAILGFPRASKAAKVVLNCSFKRKEF